MTATVKLRRTEARVRALRALAAGEVSFRSGMAGSSGSYWQTLPGTGEQTTSPAFQAAVRRLLDFGYAVHVNPGRPQRSGPLSITETGRALADRWEV